MERNEVAARIATARKAAGMRQEDLASTLGVSFNTVRNYEKGRTTPTLGKLTELARVLGVEAGWLLDGKEAA